MIKIDKVDVMNLENAIRGARNPMNSWNRMDSGYGCRFYDRVILCDKCTDKCGNYGRHFVLGDNDLDLAKRLCNAGSDHRKFLRQIFVSMDITAPLYWFKEYDTYKIGTTANSTSTMHKIHAKEFTLDDFSHDKLHESDNGFIKAMDGNYMLCNSALTALETFIGVLNAYRELYLETKDKEYWYSMIQLLPSSYNQLRTCTMTYENLRNMYHSRKNHKLDEWKDFCKWVETLPYAKELIIGDDN